MTPSRGLSDTEEAALAALRGHLRRSFPDWSVRLTVFGSRARGDHDPESDMDVLVDVDVDRVSFPEKLKIRRAAGEASLESGIILNLLVVDRRLRRERGDFSIFQTIKEEGIAA